MSLRVVGAGLGRTGTMSLQVALERLLGQPCYHMREVFKHPDHVARWHAAAMGEAVDWDELLAGYGAAVDWPAAAFWKPLAAANPDAVIVLSQRASPEDWWRSASQTIFATLATTDLDQLAADPGAAAWRAMWEAVARETFTPDYLERGAAMVAYERHIEAVRAQADPDRLLEWVPGDGWEPICAALGVPVPDEPFPHLNTSEEWAARGSAAVTNP